MTGICCIFNYAPHYRLAVYKLMEDQLNCRFYFGNNVRATIRKLDYQLFNHPAKELQSMWFFNRIYWISGSVNLLFKPYKQYILTGETHCLSNWVILALSKITGKQIYVWSHGWYGKETRLQALLKKAYFSLTSGVFLYGNYARQLMIKNGMDGSKLHVIYNSLDYEKSLQVRKELCQTSIYQQYFNNGNPVLIFIGRLAPVKKLDMLIQAIYKLKENKRQLNLVVIGDGVEREKLEAMVKDLDLTNHVWFYGPSYDEQITGELLYNADLCISPGNVGLTGIHALSYGTPVITHNNFTRQMPEFEAIEDGSTGAFFTEDNNPSLQEKIENWLILYPKKEAALIRACYKRIDEYYNPAFQVQVLKKGLHI